MNRKKRTAIARLGRAYRHADRLLEVLTILIKFGFEDLLSRLGFGELLIKAKKLVSIEGPEADLSRPRRTRLALESLGPVFIKWGQFLSVRDDIIPQDYLKEFSLLQDTILPMPQEKAEKIFSENLDKKDFEYINLTPLAAASIAQVHQATLKTGEKVVLKIKRPGLKKQVSTDLEILKEMAVLAEKHVPILRNLNPVQLVNEFNNSLLAELNFNLEATNQERFYRLYISNKTVKIPKVYREYSNENVLVMEELFGYKFDELDKQTEFSINKSELAELGAKIILEQILVFGYFHADPHPGNFLVGPGPTIKLLDFGLVGYLNKKTRNRLLDLAVAIVKRKPKVILRHLLKLTDYEEEPDREQLEKEIENFLELYLDEKIKNIKMSKLLIEVLNIAAQHNIKAPTNLAMLIKTLTQIEGIASQLDPNFNLNEVAAPIITALYKKRYSPKTWLNSAGDLTSDLLSLIYDLPHDLRPLMNILRSGRLKADFNIEGLEDLKETVDRASYRLSIAIVLAALIIGSSVVLNSNLPPKWREIPVLGLLGFLTAGVLGFWLLYDFIKKGRY